MRFLTDHITNPVNDTISIRVLDEPGHGGASHEYLVAAPPESKSFEAITIKFQNGPLGEFGVNGVTQEVLLAIVVDRLRSFQAGQYACRENALALTKIEEAMHWLNARTLERMRRGVEGSRKL